MKNLKIEFKDGKYYLNTKSTKDAIHLALSILLNRGYALKDIKIQDIESSFVSIKKQMKWFTEYESKRKDRLAFSLCNLKTEEGFNVPKAHYSCETKISSSFGEKVVFHGSSNINFKLLNTQEKLPALNELLKAGQINPGTILTSGDYQLKLLSSKTKYISR